ncbi:hypothetical protein [Erwinia sp. Leaf53]|uniref:ECs1072 family phage-associated protein n=1 Tax=Erwinia sp. Leaf53 TaxID=1736225 RepID=UPI00092E90EC|nr:hypothetical protein [Erwinia sp. Leaf53]
MARPLSKLFIGIKERIAKVKGVNISDSTENDDVALLYNRAILLFSLDIILEEHRINHSSIFNPQKNKDTIHHLILKKYGWTLNEIESLSLEQSLFVLQENLRLDNLPEDAKKYLHGINAHSYRRSFDDILDLEWDPAFGQQTLSPQQ